MITAITDEKIPSNLRPVTKGAVQEDPLILLHPEEPAHIISSDQEALEVAHRLAASFEQEASVCDRDRRLPFNELAEFSQSGLLGIPVPKEYGAAGVSNVTLAEVTAIISEADSSLGQIPQNHFYTAESVHADGSESQKQFYFARVLAVYLAVIIGLFCGCWAIVGEYTAQWLFVTVDGVCVTAALLLCMKGQSTCPLAEARDVETTTTSHEFHS